MADFRRCIPVLAVLAILLAGAASAQTPTLQCVANAASVPVIRSEGLTELVGDVLLNCTGGTATPLGGTIPPVNVQIFMGTTVTSKLLTTGGLTEALLMLDEPGVNPNNTVQFPCYTAPSPCAAVGNGAGFPTYYGSGLSGTFGNNRNVFQGQKAPGREDSILWLGVPIDPPGTTAVRVIRITNVRINANALGTASNAAVSTNELVTATGAFAIPINNPNPVVGVIQKSLQFSVTNAPTTFQQCFSKTGARAATLNYTELVASAFKKYNRGSGDGGTETGLANQDDFSPLLNSNTETGYFHGLAPNAFLSTNGLNSAGLPNFGTRFQAVFNNVPAGVTLTVSVASLPSVKDRARMVANGSSSFSGITGSTTNCGGVDSCGTVSLSGGSGTATWEVTEGDNNSFITHSFNVYITYTANPGGNSPAIGPTATVNGSYSPISTVTTAVASPIPRFADTSTATNIFTIVPCVTNLLFPFVTNQVGFDTGLAISSTSTDPFGTSPQSGTCTLNWYGANAPAATLTPTVSSGTTYTTLASIAAPNFQGYMIAVCRFQYGHGFAFVSDLGAKTIAMGYLALIIPDPAAPRQAYPFPCSGSGTAGTPTLAGCTLSGEQLGQ